MSVNSRLRWLPRHGIAGLAVRTAARRGNLDGRLLRDPAVVADPYPTYDAIRAQGRLTKAPLGLSTAHHDVCSEILRSDTFGVQLRTERLPSLLRPLFWYVDRSQTYSPIEPPSMLAVDPPDHTRYRRLVTKVFTARAIEKLRHRTEEIASELLDDLQGEEVVDLVERYASLLPVTVISEILGVPLEMREQFLVWGGSGAVTLDIGLPYSTFRRAEADIMALHSWMVGHFNRLRRAPGEDILSQLVQVADEGELTEDELSAIAMLLLGAGFETTVNLLGNGALLLMGSPESRALLAQDPELWPNAVEEILRYESPVQRTARTAMRDTEIAGQPIPQGELIVTLIGGANRDPAIFPDPHRFDICRANARDHLAFSSGIHFCLGAALAKLEGEIGLRQLFARYPDLSIAGPPQRRTTRVLRGYDKMPVRLGSPATAPRSVGAPVTA
jgi:cytochrome P450